METAKSRKLEAAGWQIGDVADLLALSEGEAELVEIKLRSRHDETAELPTAAAKYPRKCRAIK